MSTVPDKASATAAGRSPSLDPTHVAEPATALRGFTVSVVFPVLNEADGLQVVLPEIPEYVTEVIIVDGGSVDDTRKVIAEACPDALVLTQDGRGKGNALKAGVSAATGDIVITMDADGSMDPGDIGPAVLRLLDGCDFVKGSRSMPGGGSSDFTAVRKAGNSFLTGVANAMFGKRYTDITYGFNAYWRGMFADVHGLADGFEFEIQAAVRAVRCGLRTAEVPCYEADRVGGTSKLHAVRDGWMILRVLFAEAVPRRSRSLRAMADVYLADERHALPRTDVPVNRDLHAVR